MMPSSSMTRLTSGLVRPLRLPSRWGNESVIFGKMSEFVEQWTMTSVMPGSSSRSSCVKPSIFSSPVFQS